MKMLFASLDIEFDLIVGYNRSHYPLEEELKAKAAQDFTTIIESPWNS